MPESDAELVALLPLDPLPGWLRRRGTRPPGRTAAGAAAWKRRRGARPAAAPHDVTETFVLHTSAAHCRAIRTSTAPELTRLLALRSTRHGEEVLPRTSCCFSMCGRRASKKKRSPGCCSRSDLRSGDWADHHAAGRKLGGRKEESSSWCRSCKLFLQPRCP